jgi:hypothetical protein
MNLDVLLIYRLMSRMHGLLGYTATFGSTSISRFFMVYLSVHKLIEHPNACFVVPVDSHTLHCVACEI